MSNERAKRTIRILSDFPACLTPRIVGLFKIEQQKEPPCPRMIQTAWQLTIALPCYQALGRIYPQLSDPAKDWFVGTRSRGRSLLYNLGLGVLTSSVALVASTLCLQAAILGQDDGSKADDRPSVDIRSGFDSGREQKLRLFTLEPGGTLELHSLKDRPAILHVIKGTLTSQSQGKPEVVLRAGVGLAEDTTSDYSVRNTGAEPAEFIWLPVYKTTP